MPLRGPVCLIEVLRFAGLAIGAGASDAAESRFALGARAPDMGVSEACAASACAARSARAARSRLMAQRTEITVRATMRTTKTEKTP